MPFMKSKLNFGKSKEKVKPVSTNSSSEYEMHLKALLNDANPSSPKQTTNSPISPKRPISLPLQISPAPVSPHGENEAPQGSPASSIQAPTSLEDAQDLGNLQLVEIENYYLFEQNKHFKRELLHCKLSVEAVKRVVSSKEGLINQLQIDREALEAKARHLERVLSWFKSNAPQSLIDACPYAPKNDSSVSLTSGSSIDFARSSADSSRTKSKEKRKSSSYKFVKDLFKFNKPSTKLPETTDLGRNSTDEWITCEDEEFVEETELNNGNMLSLLPMSSDLNASNLSSTILEVSERKSSTLLSTLRNRSSSPDQLSPKSSSSNLSNSSKNDPSSRAELRSHLFAHCSPYQHSSPSASSSSLPQISLSSETQEETEIDLDNIDHDVDAELAALTPEDLDTEPYYSYDRSQLRELASQLRTATEVTTKHFTSPRIQEDEDELDLDNLDHDIDAELAALTPEDLDTEPYLSNDRSQLRELSAQLQLTSEASDNHLASRIQEDENESSELNFEQPIEIQHSKSNIPISLHSLKESNLEKHDTSLSFNPDVKAIHDNFLEYNPHSDHSDDESQCQSIPATPEAQSVCYPINQNSLDFKNKAPVPTSIPTPHPKPSQDTISKEILENKPLSIVIPPPSTQNQVFKSTPTLSSSPILTQETKGNIVKSSPTLSIPPPPNESPSSPPLIPALVKLHTSPTKTRLSLPPQLKNDANLEDEDDQPLSFLIQRLPGYDPKQPLSYRPNMHSSTSPLPLSSFSNCRLSHQIAPLSSEIPMPPLFKDTQISPRPIPEKSQQRKLPSIPTSAVSRSSSWSTEPKNEHDRLSSVQSEIDDGMLQPFPERRVSGSIKPGPIIRKSTPTRRKSFRRSYNSSYPINGSERIDIAEVITPPLKEKREVSNHSESSHRPIRDVVSQGSLSVTQA